MSKERQLQIEFPEKQTEPMKLPALTRDDIVNASRKDALIVETAHQIIKDFAEFGLDVTFSGVAGQFFAELYDQMRQHVQQLMEESTSRFQALLYRIDVSQRDVDQYHRQMPTANYADVLTELIIHREIKKVMVRDYFRTHGAGATCTDEDAEPEARPLPKKTRKSKKNDTPN